MRVAITSTDGRSVDEAFDLAKDFFIYEISNGRKVFLEKRSSDRYSLSMESPRFKRNRFKKVLDTIKDCKSVYTKGISEIVAGKLTESGIETKLFNGTVAQI